VEFLIMPWQLQFHPLAENEYLDQPDDIQAHLIRISDAIEQHGPQGLPPNTTKHIQGRIWEFRLRGRDGISRALYASLTGQRVMVLRIFVKKTQALPRRELELATSRLRQLV
jgi:phage-related protein